MTIFSDGVRDMQEAQTWRELLRVIISDYKEKQRILDELSITAITLNRWVNGDSAPRAQNLRQLVRILPLYSEQFRHLLKDETGLENFPGTSQDDIIKDIPSEFYGRVLLARATTNENLRFWSTSHLILQQAIGQLDPDRYGISIWIVRCMPPSGPHNKVRSLRESVGLGTPPWTGNLEQTAMFLGAESLAGNVFTLCRPGIIQNLDEEHNLPAIRGDHEKSAAIYPILYAGRIAGVFLISSARYSHFLSQTRTDLAQRYADLAALAFEPEDFYHPDQVSLCIMPTPDEQKIHFANFRQRVAETMFAAASRNEPVNNIQADMLVWKKLEEEFLKIPLRYPFIGHSELS
jgi:hypothetical protein